MEERVGWRLATLAPRATREPALRDRPHPRALVHILDVGGEDASLHVSATGRKKDIVGMPIDGEHCRADGLLEQARDPPVVVRIEGANSDGATNTQS